MNEIRSKDEDYWNKYRGTPKAFINYEKGKEIWGNNFGPATAIRFPAGISEKEIEDNLNGSIDPGKTGFMLLIYHANLSKLQMRVSISALFS